MTEPTRPCGTCGMPCTPGEYHPYAACLMFKACHNSETVRANLGAVRATPPAVAGKPVAWLSTDSIGERYLCFTNPNDSDPARPLVFGDTTPQPTQAQAVAIPLTDREIELIDGMIQVQLDHASRCDAIANRSMADKQKGWDMERVAILQKFKAHGIKGGQHGAE